MPNRPILFDTTRLLTRLKHPTPSGIDRVDLAYAHHYLTEPGERLGVSVGHFGSRILPRRWLDRLMVTVNARWKEELPAERDEILAEIRRQLAGEAPPGRLGTLDAASLFTSLSFGISEQVLKASTFHWRQSASAPANAIYVHTSHLKLDRPEHFAWLERRPDIRSVFFVHDLIPVDYPEYVRPGIDARHKIRMATIARHAAAVIVNSADVGARFEAYVKEVGLPSPPVTVAPLAVQPVFQRTPRLQAPGRPYFVVCSTIEARKNHLLLLQIWREFVERLGPDTPALVLVGRRGWESEAAIDLLDRCDRLKGHVFEASGLSTAGLADLVAGARALLMPSFAEGYGIPIVEALAVGTPVIASDIAVHREVAGPHGRFVHPLDGLRWAREVMAFAEGPPRGVEPGGFVAPTWDHHFGIVDNVLAGL